MAEESPYRIHHLKVSGRRYVSPSLRRIAFVEAHRGALEGFVRGRYDDSVLLFLPRPGQEEPLVPTRPDWRAEWEATDPGRRAVVRPCTVSAFNPEDRGTPGNAGDPGYPAQVEIDFAVRPGPEGPAAAWAAQGSYHQRAAVLVPTAPERAGRRFRLPGRADRVVLVADHSALPAAMNVLACLPAGLPALAFLGVPALADRLSLFGRAAARVSWHRGASDAAVAGLRRAELSPAGRPYVWVAGGSEMVEAARTHLIHERGFAPGTLTCTDYWRPGTSGDRFLPEAGG